MKDLIGLGLGCAVLVVLVLLVLVLLKLSKMARQSGENRDSERIRNIEDYLRQVEQSLVVLETRLEAQDNQSLKLNTLVDSRLRQLSEQSDRLVKTVEAKLTDIQRDNEKRLEQIRQTVEEKLESTLESRLATSFKQVGEQLESVYKELGEMHVLAKGVGNLERVLTNVKTRGIWGELQAERILQEMLQPDQYVKNVVTKREGRDAVEFAVKLPGATNNEHVLLPIDSKFPREDYERLCNATEVGDVEQVRVLRRAIEKRILDEARDIRSKYIEVPYTTDFAVMFLPIEGLFAEVLAIPGLQERVQREFHVMIAGPTTLASLLNSLQMGFRTLAIERKSSEVWRVLGEVKSEYAKFGIVLEAVRKKISAASTEIDRAFTRHRVMGRRLSGVEAVESSLPSELLDFETGDMSEEGASDDATLGES